MTHELEKEFNKIVLDHKYIIISSSLIEFEKEGIYNSSLLREKYGDDKMSEKGQDRAFKVTDDLEENADRETYNKIYEMCWKRAKYKLQDKLYGYDN